MCLALSSYDHLQLLAPSAASSKPEDVQEVLTQLRALWAVERCHPLGMPM